MRNWDKKEPGTKKNRYRLYQKIEGRKKKMKEHKKSKASGITLIALVVTIIVNRVFYDKNKNISNLVGFIL